VMEASGTKLSVAHRILDSIVDAHVDGIQSPASSS